MIDGLSSNILVSYYKLFLLLNFYLILLNNFRNNNIKINKVIIN